MADEQKPEQPEQPAEGAEDESAGEQEPQTKGDGRWNGLPDGATVDLPYESGSPDPQEIEYADLGEKKRYQPDQPFRSAQARAGGEGEFGQGDNEEGDGDGGGSEPEAA